jgi:hypothetical protein
MKGCRACPESEEEEGVMKKLTVKASWVVLATAAIAVGSASAARANEPIVTNARVPFAFIVGDVRLPAGDYDVEEMALGSPMVAIVSADGKKAALTLTIPWSPLGEAPAQPELRFEKLGREYFLARIVPSEGDGREILLTPSVMEQEIVKAAEHSSN